MSWRALRWAFDCDKVESWAEKTVLVEYANHANDDGYTWPSLKFIALRWHTHPARLRRAREALIAKKLLFRTKKRRGITQQNKVFRMPKFTYERGPESPPSQQHERGRKGGGKGAIRGSKSPTNLKPIIYNHEEERMASQKPYLSSSSEGKKISRPASNRPTDDFEVIDYFDECGLWDADSHALTVTDALWFYEANQANDWKTGGKYIENWRAWFNATYYAGKFPSQREGKKT
jgi:hypothetical protein